MRKFPTREAYEAAKAEADAFIRLFQGEDYAASLGKWIEAELKSPLVIDCENVTDPEKLGDNYWFLMGKRQMLYDLVEQVKAWRETSKLRMEDVDIANDPGPQNLE